ncbi:hypothetical protein ACNVED_16620 (plasmid) [Legionella sp. D16C41]|uniref:hypothetical protein n=1 Tax=Legionella sp. D16C41 TaxID=3402688 RepID=UPI003AF94F4F
MKIKNDTSVKSDRSLINHDFLTSNATAVIGIYGYDNSSRSIYIESGKEERSITRYVITFPASGFASDAANGWTVNSLKISTEVATEIRELRKKSHTQKELQVSNEDMQIFKNTLDTAAKEKYILNGEQDYDIKKGLEEINVDIEFPRFSGCTIL